MLRASARELLAKECSPKVVRRIMESADGDDAALWKKIADAGWTALGISEEYGGGGTFLALVVVLGEGGGGGGPGPSFPSAGRAVRPPARCAAPAAEQRRV